jgi:hypothetical protein
MLARIQDGSIPISPRRRWRPPPGQPREGGLEKQFIFWPISKLDVYPKSVDQAVRYA